MAAGTGPTPQVLTILGLTAAVDLLAGIALSVLGLSKDNQALAIVGVVLLASGGAMLAWVTMQREKPQSL